MLFLLKHSALSVRLPFSSLELANQFFTLFPPLLVTPALVPLESSGPLLTHSAAC